MRVLGFIILLLSCFSGSAKDLKGAWTATQEDIKYVMIIADGFLTVAEFKENEFLHTWGGLYDWEENTLTLNLEYHTQEAGKVGSFQSYSWSIEDNELEFNQKKWTRIDDGSPGALPGAWIIVGREVNGEMTNRQPGSRKTMKVLSGTRFQWIAYDIDSRSFMGSGGGTYTTIDGKYTESIDFFSRDNNRVGAELSFDFELKNKQWQHKGLNSKGKPIHEIWTHRKN